MITACHTRGMKEVDVHLLLDENWDSRVLHDSTMSN